MKIAKNSDKNKVVEILTNSFIENKSIDYIIPNDSSRVSRIRELMTYSFDMCMISGKVCLADDETGCALISFPERKKMSPSVVFLELKLILFSIGVKNISRALKREKIISSHYPKSPIYYLWFIGVHPEFQNKGVGQKLLEEIVADASSMNRPVFLETSTLKNIPWYQKFGFSVYDELDFGYKLFLISNNKKCE